MFPSGGHGCTLKTRARLISGERWRGLWEFTIRSALIPLSHDISREAVYDEQVGWNGGGRGEKPPPILKPERGFEPFSPFVLVDLSHVSAAHPGAQSDVGIAWKVVGFILCPC